MVLSCHICHICHIIYKNPHAYVCTIYTRAYADVRKKSSEYSVKCGRFGIFRFSVASFDTFPRLDFFGTVRYYDIASLVLIAHTLESQVFHGPSHPVDIEGMCKVATDSLKNGRRSEELALFALYG